MKHGDCVRGPFSLPCKGTKHSLWAPLTLPLALFSNIISSLLTATALTRKCHQRERSLPSPSPSSSPRPSSSTGMILRMTKSRPLANGSNPQRATLSTTQPSKNYRPTCASFANTTFLNWKRVPLSVMSQAGSHACAHAAIEIFHIIKNHTWRGWRVLLFRTL